VGLVTLDATREGLGEVTPQPFASTARLFWWLAALALLPWLFLIAGMFWLDIADFMGSL
jgi:hypothetical protein